jgi:hypothetical protein
MSENKSHESVEQIEENEEIEVNRVKSLKTNIKGGGWTLRTMTNSGQRTCCHSGDDVGEFLES